MERYIQVTKDEFYDFINSYPNELVHDCFGASEPATFTYNDFSDANKYPESIVGKYYKEDKFRGNEARYYLVNKDFIEEVEPEIKERKYKLIACVPVDGLNIDLLISK